MDFVVIILYLKQCTVIKPVHDDGVSLFWRKTFTQKTSIRALKNIHLLWYTILKNKIMVTYLQYKEKVVYH